MPDLFSIEPPSAAPRWGLRSLVATVMLLPSALAVGGFWLMTGADAPVAPASEPAVALAMPVHVADAPSGPEDVPWTPAPIPAGWADWIAKPLPDVVIALPEPAPVVLDMAPAKPAAPVDVVVALPEPAPVVLDGATPAPSVATAAPRPHTVSTEPVLTAATLALILRRAQALWGDNDVVAMRLLLAPAVAAGDADAALLMAHSYDPQQLAAHPLLARHADAAKAGAFYALAQRRSAERSNRE